jgi:hypothetical protein
MYGEEEEELGVDTPPAGAFTEKFNYPLIMGDLLATLQQTIEGPRAWEGFEPKTFGVPSENATTCL